MKPHHRTDALYKTFLRTVDLIPLAKLGAFLYAGEMTLDLHEPIGLMADSHGKTGLMSDAIQMFKEMGAHTIFHLGDICDSLAPHELEEAVKILREHGVQAVKGNNEYAILLDHQGERRNTLPSDVVNYLAELPYTITLGDFWFAHSTPLDWPAATRRPVAEYLPLILDKNPCPFRILFSGHSHAPSIIEIDGSRVKKIPARAGMHIPLSRDRHYVITVGAVEEASSALFLPVEYEIWFLQLGRG